MLKEKEFDKLVRIAIRRGAAHYAESVDAYVAELSERFPEDSGLWEADGRDMRAVFGCADIGRWIDAYQCLDTVVRDRVLSIIVAGEPDLEEAHDRRHGGYWVRGLSRRRV